MALAAATEVDAAPPTNCDRCFAMVRANGTIVKHRNVGTVYKNGPGGYLLVFSYSINKCALSANVDSLVMEQNVRLGFVSIARASNTSVWVDIYAPTGGGGVFAVDYPFTIVATC
jgi:hypothetical protein